MGQRKSKHLSAGKAHHRLCLNEEVEIELRLGHRVRGLGRPGSQGTPGVCEIRRLAESSAGLCEEVGGPAVAPLDSLGPKASFNPDSLEIACISCLDFADGGTRVSHPLS